jgi:hypothetical protein
MYSVRHCIRCERRPLDHLGVGAAREGEREQAKDHQGSPLHDSSLLSGEANGWWKVRPYPRTPEMIGATDP